MTHTVVIHGDPIERLQALIRRAGVVTADDDLPDELRRHCRGLVVGLDLSESVSPRKTRALLKQEAVRWGEQLRRYPSAVHLLIAVHLPPHVTQSRFLSTADGLSLRIHAELERRARYVDVTLLDVTSCDDAERLADRLLERISGTAGGYPAAALTWSDIRDTSIAAATAANNG